MIRFAKQKYVTDCWRFVDYYCVPKCMSSNLSYNQRITSSSTTRDVGKPIISLNYISAMVIPIVNYYCYNILCEMMNISICIYFPSESRLNSVVDQDDQI